MFVLVVTRVGSSQTKPLVYGPFDTEDEAEQQWERLNDLRTLIGDLITYHVVPLCTDAPVLEPKQPELWKQSATPPVIIYYPQPWISPLPNYYPWIYYNQPVTYRVTWGNNTDPGDGVYRA
jgi:hypothetical protein